MYDLHTHSTFSDGSFTPEKLVRCAALSGITHLALSDHDCTDGIEEARLQAKECEIQLIPAVELSVSWHGKSIHILGLNIDPGTQSLQQGLSRIQATRLSRAEEMGRRLAKKGIEGSFEACVALAGKGMITRSHFAQYLVSIGVMPDIRDVFNHYLAEGKPGYVPTQWAELSEAIGWVLDAGGIAVIAHPQRYKLTSSWLRRLIIEFKECGGQGIEVVSGRASDGDIQSSAHYAKKFELYASAGSDFHGPMQHWVTLGSLPALPEDLKPVWNAFHE